MVSLYTSGKTFTEFETQAAETWELEAGYRLVDV